MAEFKTNTRKRDYHVAVSLDGKTVATVTVRAEGVRDAIDCQYTHILYYSASIPNTFSSRSRTVR